MPVQRHLRFQPQRIPASQAAGDDREFAPRFHHAIPDVFTGCYIGRHVNFKAILTGVSGARDQVVLQAADRSVREPVILDAVQFRAGQLLQEIHGPRSLNRQLRVGVALVLDDAIETLRILAHPVDVFLARPGIDHQQKIVFAQPVHDDIVHKRALRIEHG